MMKIKYILVFLMAFLGCRIATNPEQISYLSIKVSKEEESFVAEYQPVVPYLKIGEKSYHVKEAWVEHPHYERNFADELQDSYCFVMNFYDVPNDTTQLHDYVYGFGGSGSSKIWFGLAQNDYPKDTIIVYYRENLNLKKNKDKQFLLVRKNK